MASTYYIQSEVSNGDFIIPVANPSSLIGVCSITYYTDSSYTTPVKPDSGITTFTVSEDNFNFGEINNGTITHSTTGSYNRPHFMGYCNSVRVNLQDIVGATHFTARVHLSYGGL